ncbi:hypothetical protein LguiB_035633 [Lonicera macranthoides]
MATKLVHSKQHSRNKRKDSTAIEKWYLKKRKKQKFSDNRSLFRLQDDLLSPDLILKKVFQKDGPPLGVEFDSLPCQAFRLSRKASFDLVQHLNNITLGWQAAVIHTCELKFEWEDKQLES